jgi:hypothetical protein
MTRRQLSELERLLSQYAYRYHSLQRIDINKLLKIIQKYYINPYLRVEKQCCRNLKLSGLQPLSVKKLACDLVKICLSKPFFSY